MADVEAIAEKKAGFVKPEKPDEATYHAELKKAEKDHADVMARFNAVKAKIDLAQPNKNKDSPSGQRRGELLSQLKEIREKQASGKSGRKELFDKIQKLDTQVKTEIAAQKTARSRVSYRSLEDLEKEISRLNEQVDKGQMKIVDEKKTLAEISSLNKNKKVFAGFEDAQKKIDSKKAELKKLRDTLDDPESKALSEKYNKLQAELDVIKAEQDGAYKSINTLRDERTKLHNEQQEKYLAIKKVKDTYYEANRAVQKYEYESRQRARERKKTEQENYVKEKKKERAQQLLAEASDPAYIDDIRRAESLVRFFDPSYSAEKAPLQAPSKFTIQATRTVNDSGIKGARVISKKDKEEDFFAAKETKKGKKNKRNNATASGTPATGKYSCPPSVMEDCAAMGIDPPMRSEDVPEVLEKVHAKLKHWKEDQAKQTEKNIAKAKKEVERLDAEDSGVTTPTTEAPVHANGDGKATAGVDEGGSVKNEIDLLKSAEKDVAEDLKAATLEDAKA